MTVTHELETLSPDGYITIHSVNASGIINVYLKHRIWNSDGLLVSHFTSQRTSIANTTSEGFHAVNGALYLRIDSSRIGGETVENVKEYLAAQISAGTPVTVAYRITNPYTIQLTPQELALLHGANNLWSDCGNTDLVYVADLQLYIDQRIAAIAAAVVGQ